MWRYHGMTTSDPYNAKGRGSCDRCTQQWDLNQLQYQYDFRGDTLTNTRFRVCPPCMDKPYEGNRPIKLPADPIPLLDPRVEPLQAEENAVGLPARTAPLILPGMGGIPSNSSANQGYISPSGETYITESANAIYVPE